jgi:hypothetical protein
MILKVGPLGINRVTTLIINKILMLIFFTKSRFRAHTFLRSKITLRREKEIGRFCILFFKMKFYKEIL